MRNTRIALGVSTVLFLISALPAFAALPSVDVPLQCTVVDTEGNSHPYSGQYLGICALAAAKEQGVVSAYTLQNFSFGLFLQSLNGITPGATEFWDLFQNGTEASVGLSDMIVAQGDTLKFQLTDFTTNAQVGSPVEFSIRSLVGSSGTPQAHASSSGAGEYLKGRVFNVPAAIAFLAGKQNPDGSFSSDMLADWAAIAFGSIGEDRCNETCRDARARLRVYLVTRAVVTSSPTDLERHTMALEALGVNPYTVSGAPVEALVAKFDGRQMGDPSLVNDDIFALFPLLHAGYTKEDPMIEAIATFILSKQKMNGSWEDSVDLTASAIQALELFPERAQAVEATKKAEEFLRRNQDDSGIFGPNSFSLSWVLQAIASLGETPDDWKKSGVTPLSYLGVLQQEDGGVEPVSVGGNTRVWATSYAIPAALGEPWDRILGGFARPEPIEASEQPTPPTPPPSPQTSEAASESYPTTAIATHVVTSEHSSEAYEYATSAVSEATTVSAVVQTAAAAEPAGKDDAWVWLGGLLLILGATLYFFRRT